jgi:hypothetical protein
MTSMADSEIQMQAFEIVRENLETLLSQNSVQETTEYGSSDKYPDIQWKTVVETFYEPITAQLWLKGTCSADYFDSSGERQTVELTHWLTGLTEAQLLQIMMQEEEEQEWTEDQLIETVEDAAEYAGVEPEIIEQWLEDDMQTTDEGFFIKSELDLYKSYLESQKTEGTSETDQPAEAEQDQDGRITETEQERDMMFEEFEQMNISETGEQ